MVANQSFWILGVILLCIAHNSYSQLYCEGTFLKFAVSGTAHNGGSIAVVAFMIMMANSVQLAPEQD